MSNQELKLPTKPEITTQVFESNKVTIQTKFFSPTNSRGARVKAYSSNFENSKDSVILSWDYELNASENHANAAKQLCAKMDWTGELQMGSIKFGYVFVFLN